MALSQTAVDWVSRQLVLQSYMVNRVIVEGLQALTVNQLKQIWSFIQPHCGIHLGKSAKKQRWVDTVETQLKRSDILAILSSSSSSSSSSRTPPQHSISTASAITAPYASTNNNIPRPMHLPRPPRRGNFIPNRNTNGIGNNSMPRMSAEDATEMLRLLIHDNAQSIPHYPRPPGISCPGWYTGHTHQPHPHPPSHRPFPHSLPPTHSGGTNISCANTMSLPSSALTSASSTNTSTSAPIASAVKVKTEPGQQIDGVSSSSASLHAHSSQHHYCQNQKSSANPSPPSLSFHDHHLMTSLRQMGFTDENEIRQAIRVHSDADACMMWIISQREELEEARKMDEARARSELLRAEAAVERKRTAYEAFEQTKPSEWKTLDRFQSSIVLEYAHVQLAALKESHCQVLYKFLQLEEQILKWYKDVPWCYLVELACRWRDTAPTCTDLESTMMELETSMYSLEHQQGGIPKLFLAKQREAEKLGKPTRPNNNNNKTTSTSTTKQQSDTDSNNINNDDDDDDVIVLLDPPPSSSMSNKRQKKDIGRPSSPVEVIEIL